jgi:metallophosphoesterase (TIGR00282 family)
MSTLRILHIADIMGEPGRKAVTRLVPQIVRDREVGLVLGNAENAAGGFGLTKRVAEDLYGAGVHVLTGGNHMWDRREILDFIDEDNRILRPANYPGGVPGRGSGVYTSAGNHRVGVLNLLGRVFIKEVECPFKAADREIAHLKEETPIIIVDLHAEATSEKMAMGWHLDGRVTAVLGTHTHVQTADERVLPNGTAFICDVGMTGPFDSIIGIQKELALRRFLTQLPVRFSVAKNDVFLNAVIVDADTETGRATSIERLQMPLRAGN